MATNLSTILSWFMTSKKPTQAQFWATWTSFWHKDETIPQNSISGLINVLNAKTENDQFNAHKTDVNAHSDLFAKVRIVANGRFTIYKNSLNINPETAYTLEANDVACGFIPNTQIFIPFGMYLGGDIADTENWNTSPMDFS